MLTYLACKVCNGRKRATMQKLNKDGTCSEAVGIYPEQVPGYKRDEWIVVEVFCEACGLMYHRDTI